jgi:hypothetical protein
MGIYWNICAACDRFMASWNQTVIDFARNGNFFFLYRTDAQLTRKAEKLHGIASFPNPVLLASLSSVRPRGLAPRTADSVSAQTEPPPSQIGF